MSLLPLPLKNHVSINFQCCLPSAALTSQLKDLHKPKRGQSVLLLFISSLLSHNVYTPGFPVPYTPISTAGTSVLIAGCKLLSQRSPVPICSLTQWIDLKSCLIWFLFSIWLWGPPLPPWNSLQLCCPTWSLVAICGYFNLSLIWIK